MESFTDINSFKDFVNSDNEMSIIFDSGYCKPMSLWQVEDIGTIIKTVLFHINIRPIKAEIDQIAEGLQLFDILSLVKKYPEQFRCLFVSGRDNNPLTVSLMLALCSDVHFSGDDAKRSKKEEATLQLWHQLIIEIGAGMISE